MSAVYFAGLDLGQSKDYSALAVVEATRVGNERLFSIRYLHRWPLRTSYPTICAETSELLTRTPLNGARLIVDATGVGRPVVDLFKRSIFCRRLHAVTITGGVVENKEVIEGVTHWNVPKRILVSNIQLLLQSRQLKIAPELQNAQTLAHELQDFQVRITNDAHDSYGVWREGGHDDLVLAASLGCWAALHRNFISAPIPLLLGKARGWGF